jgi:polyhydroxyalkanoate synthesis regulator phasin
MKRKLNARVVAGAVAGLAVAGGGAAIAADQLRSPKEESQAIVNDAAKQLGIQPSELSAALKKALENRVDEAVAAGRLTKEQGAAIKKRIESGDFPLFGGPGLGPGFHHGPFPGFGFFGGLDAAATYLGLTRTQLESRLNDGKTLAEIAKAQDKSVDGLVNAMYDAAKQKLDDAVSAGRLTKSEEQRVLADLKSRLTDFVNNAQLRLHRDRDGDHDFRGGPPEGVPFGLPGV